VLAEWIAHESVSAVHVYFPDPWWKRRHKKRRVFTEAFVDHVARVLQPSGELHVASDVHEYFELIRCLLHGHRSFVACDAPFEREAAHDLDYLTNFERKYRKEGKPIFRAVFRKTNALRAS
jgi:tRNA (guanine-N7-)-methyltransferase